MHKELLRLAELLSSDVGGLPRWVAHNRAISTAYYAVFHAVAELCARELVGAWRPWEPFRHLYRSLDHGHARRVFREILLEQRFGQMAKTLAEVFIDLQKERHGADYDPGYRVSSTELADILGRADVGISLAPQIASDERKLLAVRLIGRTRG